MDKTITSDKLITLDSVPDLRKNVGFHFTPKENLGSIFETGLEARIGRNASGHLGQSAIPKAYISYGLEGVLQLYNRLLNVPLTPGITVNAFKDEDHEPFLPQTTQEQNHKFSVLESFEFVRRYMEDNSYLIFEAPMGQYEHTLSDAELKEINTYIEQLTDNQGRNIIDLKKQYDDEIANGNETHLAERNQLAIDVWKKTLPTIQAKRGKLLNGDKNLVLDINDFNDERLRWTDFEKNPHNTHTRIFEEDGKVTGLSISPDSLRAFTIDGQSNANGLEFFNTIYGRTLPTDSLNIHAINCYDPDLLDLFSTYVAMVEQYKKDGLLVSKREEYKSTYDPVSHGNDLVVNLNNISQYPSLAEFAEQIQSTFEARHEEARALRKQLKEQDLKEDTSLLVTSSAKDPKVALAHDEAEEAVSSDLVQSPERADTTISLGDK